MQQDWLLTLKKKERFEKDELEKFNRLADSLYFSQKKYLRTLAKVKSWNKSISEIKKDELSFYIRGNKRRFKLTFIKDEQSFEDDLDLFLFRYRDILDILFRMTALLSKATNKGNELSMTDTSKFLESFKKKTNFFYLSKEFDGFLRSIIHDFELIIDIRNNLKLNGKHHLTLYDSKIWLSQNKGFMGKTRSQFLKELGIGFGKNWLVNIEDLREKFPTFLDEYVEQLNKVLRDL